MLREKVCDYGIGILNTMYDRNQKFIIYGIGNYAEILYTYLQIRNLDNQIKFFLETNIKENNKFFYGRPVKAPFDSSVCLEDSIVIIAMNEKFGNEVYSILHQINVKQIIQLTTYDINQMSSIIFRGFNTLPVNKNKIFIECFAGMGYRCNCKYIVEELMRLEDKLDIVWAVKDVQDDIPKQIKQVQRFSYDYFKELYTSGIYIGNDGHSPYIKKRKEQYYINTWHGSGPFKKVNASLFEGNEAKQKEYEEQFSIVDLFVSNTGDNTQMFRESFCYHGEIYECGSPRNDIFFQENNLREDLCKQLEIECDKKIVLYAPTFRDGDERSFESYDLDMQRVLSALEERFCSEFVLLYRFHHRLHKYEKGRNFYPDAINVTLYPDIQELLVASDVLITDYSSTMWDFSLQDRPIFLYHNDEAEYENDRGFYCPVRKWPYIKAHTTEEMIDVILKFDEGKYLEEIHAFINEYKSYDDGHASERVVERITDVINHPEKYGKE